ncbi:hypothetical protein KPL78_20490 [Roseomonas sp. HJA6]|uniref:Uncharacterized protein n=1 Tax=Roseomonas alba TaxID=2846776 RepID=A0ABS7AD77_9PROT|nr:hypothetical protein [Neoroseomonas alba]MBW6400251.1 hypothetical protein [Neoroseomonas alba]
MRIVRHSPRAVALPDRVADAGGPLLLRGPGTFTGCLHHELPRRRQMVADAGIKPE